MKTLKLSTPVPSLDDVLRMARSDTVLLTTEDGESFVVAPADDFDTEVELLRRNHAFLALLDELKQAPGAIPLSEAEAKLR